MSDANGTDTKRQLDFDDLQRESAGQDVGRMARFLGQNDPRSPEAKRKKQERQADADRRFLELQKDQEYHALYTTLGDKLSEAERQTDQAIDAARAMLDAIQRELEDMEARAARGPDGEPVFRTADGRVVDAEGEDLPPEIAAGIIWPDSAPNAEEYFAAHAQRDAVQDHLIALQGYRTDVLGDIRNRYDDTDNPMSKDDLRDALDTIAEMRPELSIAAMPVATPSTTPNTDLSALALPMKLN